MLLKFYIARQFLQSFALVFTVIIGLVYLIDSAEMFRRASSVDDITTAQVFYLAALHVPTIVETILPIVIIFSGVLAFFRMSKNLTLAIARSGGLSFWQILSPIWLIVFCFGVLTMHFDSVMYVLFL